MSGVSRRAECASCWQPQKSSSWWQWKIRLQDLRHQEELRGRFRRLVSDRMHRARTGSSQPHLGMRAGSGAIGHPQQQAKELKSQLFTAGAMICPSNRRQDQQLVPDLALAKSSRMMRHHIELLEKEAQEDEEGEACPSCFGHRIRTEKFPKGFTLPRDTPKYNGTVKPEDWLTDYMTAVGITAGSRRVAVLYDPMMLEGSALSWLNSLPSNNVNCWEDFTTAFIQNFTSTYERHNLPRQLALCVQGKDEPLRDYLSRWIKLKNSCE